VHDLTTTHLSAADAAATSQLRDAVATARRRLLDVLHARADGLITISSWSGPHRDRFDDESQALLDAGRALDDSLATLLYALDDELDAIRDHARRGLASESVVATTTLARLLNEPDVASDEQPDADSDVGSDVGSDGDTQLAQLEAEARAAHPTHSRHPTGRSGWVEDLDLRHAVVIPIRPDVAVGR
jgi:hypothetical protein